MAQIDWNLFRTPDFVGNAYAIRRQVAEDQREQENAYAAAAYRQRQEQRLDAQDQRQIAQDARQAKIDAQPKFIEGPDGVYAVDPVTGKATRVADFPVKPQTAPSGYAWGPDQKSLTFIPGGPGDPKTIAGNAYTRRDIIVKNPIPRAGGGGGSSSGLPAGFVLD